MTPEQFFDHLDEIFGCDDGYINHLQRIKGLKEEIEELKEEVEERTTYAVLPEEGAFMEENDKLKETLDKVRCYIYRIGKNEGKVFDEIVKEAMTD
jgi:hypothetical protein